MTRYLAAQQGRFAARDFNMRGAHFGEVVYAVAKLSLLLDAVCVKPYASCQRIPALFLELERLLAGYSKHLWSEMPYSAGVCWIVDPER